MDTMDKAEKAVDAPNSEEKPKKRTAFDIAQDFAANNALVRIDGALHVFNRNVYRYVPVEKGDLVKVLLRLYYKEMSESGSLRLAKECADILWHMDYMELLTTGATYTLGLQNGILDLRDIERAHFFENTQLQIIPPITYNVEVQGNVYMTNWGYAKGLATPRMDIFLSDIAMGNQVIVNRIWQMIGYLLLSQHFLEYILAENAAVHYEIQNVPSTHPVNC